MLLSCLPAAICDCGSVLTDASGVAVNETVILVVSFDVANFKSWYKEFEEMETKGYFTNAGVTTTYVGERRRSTGFFTSDVSSAHVVHLFPKAAIDSVCRAYESSDEPPAAWVANKVAISPIELSSYQLIFRDDAGDVAEADLMTSVAHKVTDVTKYLEDTALKDQDPMNGPSKTLVGKGLNGDDTSVVAVYLYPTSGKKTVSAAVAYNGEGDTVLQPIDVRESALLFKKN